jgi:hypothetical protein
VTINTLATGPLPDTQRRSWPRRCPSRSQLGQDRVEGGQAYRSGRCSGRPPRSSVTAWFPMPSWAPVTRSTTPARLITAATGTSGPAPGAPGGSPARPAAQVPACAVAHRNHRARAGGAERGQKVDGRRRYRAGGTRCSTPPSPGGPARPPPRRGCRTRTSPD